MTSFFAPLAKFISHKNPDEYTNIHHKITSYKNNITQIFIKNHPPQNSITESVLCGTLCIWRELPAALRIIAPWRPICSCDDVSRSDFFFQF